MENKWNLLNNETKKFIVALILEAKKRDYTPFETKEYFENNLKILYNFTDIEIKQCLESVDFIQKEGVSLNLLFMQLC